MGGLTVAVECVMYRRPEAALCVGLCLCLETQVLQRFRITALRPAGITMWWSEPTRCDELSSGPHIA